MKKKIFALISCILLIAVLAVPCFAYELPDRDNYMSYSLYGNQTPYTLGAFQYSFGQDSLPFQFVFVVHYQEEELGDRIEYRYGDNTIYNFVIENQEVDMDTWQYCVYIETSDYAFSYTVDSGSFSVSFNDYGIYNFSLDGMPWGTYFEIQTEYPTYMLSRSAFTVDNTHFVNQYQNGYNAGYDAGEAAAGLSYYYQGYSDGRQVGISEGYDLGYANGMEYADSNSIASAIDAAITAPATAIKGWLNFNLLGINLWAIVTGLLTLALVFFVWHKLK